MGVALRDIKRKISAVKKTRQITRAMNLVSAAKLKSAQLRMENFRPYASKTSEVLEGMALRVEAGTHPLLAVRDPKKICLIEISSDRGLCGGFNSNVIKMAENFIKAKKEDGIEVDLVTVGRKCRDYFKRKLELAGEYVDVFRKFDMSLADEVVGEIIPKFIEEEYDQLYLAFNEFKNLGSQKPTIIRLLPIPSVDRVEVDPESQIEYLYEPSEQVLLDQLLPLYLKVMVFQGLIETSAGEHAARMMAMDNATNNCKDLIDSLSLQYNKARQAAITAELMDIVGGTEALAQSK